MLTAINTGLNAQSFREKLAAKKAALEAKMTEALGAGSSKSTPLDPNVSQSEMAAKWESKEYKKFAPHGGEDGTRKLKITKEAGKVTAIVGESGSGKSTLSNLLLRLYQPPKNSIFINQTPIEEFTLASLRTKFAFVSQTVVLIDDTLANNIAFGCSGYVSRESIEQAAKAANVTSFANKLDNGLDTYIGENGKRLSGGQRQRIAIARAILRNAEIIVLDEATSALDNESEKHVQEALLTFAKNKPMEIKSITIQ